MEDEIAEVLMSKSNGSNMLKKLIAQKCSENFYYQHIKKLRIYKRHSDSDILTPKTVQEFISLNLETDYPDVIQTYLTHTPEEKLNWAFISSVTHDRINYCHLINKYTYENFPGKLYCVGVKNKYIIKHLNYIDFFTHEIKKETYEKIKNKISEDYKLQYTVLFSTYKEIKDQPPPSQYGHVLMEYCYAILHNKILNNSQKIKLILNCFKN